MTNEREPYEFRVQSDRMLDMHGKLLSDSLKTLTLQLYERLQNAAADADGVPEFVFSFRRLDFGLSINEQVEANAPAWLQDGTYRVAMLPTGRGRQFQLIRILDFYEQLKVDRGTLPNALFEALLAKDAYQPGLVLISGEPRSWRTSTGVAFARHLSNEHRVQAFLVEKSPKYIFGDADGYLTQIIGDTQAAATLAALEHRSGNKRIVFVDNTVARNLAQETLMLATRGFLVMAVVDQTQEWPLAGPIETFVAAAGRDYSRVESHMASVLHGVVRCDLSQGAGLKRGVVWHPLRDEERKLLRERNYEELNVRLSRTNQDLASISARVSNVTSLRPIEPQ